MRTNLPLYNSSESVTVAWDKMQLWVINDSINLELKMEHVMYMPCSLVVYAIYESVGHRSKRYSILL